MRLQRGSGWLVTGDGFRLGGDCLRRRSTPLLLPTLRKQARTVAVEWRHQQPGAEQRATWASADRSTLLTEWVSSMGAECANAHMVRCDTKIQVNSANHDLILHTHKRCRKSMKYGMNV